MNDEENERRWAEVGKKLFSHGAEFFTAAPHVAALPPIARPEIAFWGRSNVGKSSLINALTNQKDLARTSNTPGRTQELIFFNVNDELTVVDMPGYGFAKAPLPLVEKWAKFSKAFLRGRSSLKRVFLLVDGRHGVKPIDEEHMKLLDDNAVSYVVVLTKADDMKKSEIESRIQDVIAKTQKHPAAFPHIILTSAKKGDGLDDLKTFIARTMEIG